MSAYHALETYTLQAPAWREPLTIATSAYPELYPGATALYPPTSGSSTGTSTYAGQSRDAANVETGIVGVTKAKEDDLSETTVKTGLVTRPYVQVRIQTATALQLSWAKSSMSGFRRFLADAYDKLYRVKHSLLISSYTQSLRMAMRYRSCPSWCRWSWRNGNRHWTLHRSLGNRLSYGLIAGQLSSISQSMGI
jgi:hypothetical protein